MIDVVKNLLDKESYNYLNKEVLNINFPWFYIEGQDNPNDGRFQFVHNIILDSNINSTYYNVFKNLFFKSIKINNIYRLKVNLTTKIIDKEKCGTFHIDEPELIKNNKNLKTSIYYFNDNNGGTEFVDKTFIKSEKNKLITFNSKLKHRAVSHTDKNINKRIVINFLYD